jgi:spore maturation protein CgeB
VWDGIDSLFKADREIILARSTGEVVARLIGGNEAGTIGKAARERILSRHTAAHRAIELEQYIADTARQGAEPDLIAAAE